MSNEKYSHLGSLHENYKFMAKTPRAAREAFGHGLGSSSSSSDGHRTGDTWVLWACIVCAVAGLVVEVLYRGA